MRTLILGGYGHFGARLSELLAATDGISLIVSGRSLEKAQKVCQTLPARAQAKALELNRQDSLHKVLREEAVDLVIDASGPFQAYGDNPYGVIKACLDCHCHYLDFADGSDFVAGVSEFNNAAQQAGIYILSGASSFPVLSAAVVRRLSKELSTVASIRGGIAPSPYARMGLNVIKAIASYAGKPLTIHRRGRLSTAYPITETTRFTIAPPGAIPLGKRLFSLVDVPDLRSLPLIWPHVETVWMGAGPIPESLHRILIGLAWLVRLGLLKGLSALSPLFFWGMRHLRWGEHRGGMFIEVTGLSKDRVLVRRSWHMLAEGDDGPYIPCMAIQALVQRTLRGQQPQLGSRSAAADLELDDYEQLFNQRAIVTGIRRSEDSAPSQGVFQQVLGSAWDKLAAAVKSFHLSSNGHHLAGLANVQRGTHWLSNRIADWIGFPLAGDAVDVEVQTERSDHEERWTRRFAQQTFSSRFTVGSGAEEHLLIEHIGPFSVGIALVVDEQGLNYVVRRWRLWGIPLPARLAPAGRTLEYANDDRFCFDVEISHPWLGLIVRYSGELSEHQTRHLGPIP